MKKVPYGVIKKIEKVVKKYLFPFLKHKQINLKILNLYVTFLLTFLPF